MIFSDPPIIGWYNLNGRQHIEPIVIQLRGFFMKDIIYFYYDSKKRLTFLVDKNGNRHSIESKPIPVLKQICLRYGTSLQGARQSFSFLTGAKKKIPICVSVANQILFIPTLAESSEDCYYIQYNCIDCVKPTEIGCRVFFKCGQSLDLSISFRTIQRQRSRCSIFFDQIMNH